MAPVLADRKKMEQPPIDKKYIAVIAIAVFFTWILHELAHWIAGGYLGYNMSMTLNATYPTNEKYSNDFHYQIISSAGSIFTLSEAFVVYILMIQKRRKLLYPFLFACFYMRLLASVISLWNSNDEARVSSALGIGKFTLPIIITMILFVLVFKTSKAYKFGTRFNLANLALTIMFSSIIIVSDMYFKIRLF